MHETVQTVTARIVERSADSRAAYLDRIRAAASNGPHRQALSCGNLAHGFAAAPGVDKVTIRYGQAANIGIVSAYNDMLSAHQPLERYPALIKEAAREAECTAQFAGGVPAMCDGVTQGQPGMELSLFSRDTIAMATAVSLSHNMFDGVLCLGVCDKIVPGLMIGALSFGHLPVIFVPAGPMPSGLPNDEKAKIRTLYAQGKVGRDDLLEAESKSYHGPGTCTFYGTANSNQMMMEVMGLHMPGTAFVNPNTPLRDALTKAAAKRVAEITALGDNTLSMGDMVDARSIVNAMVGLLATGGSTNHTIHLVAMARAAGIQIDWQDFADLSHVVPLMTRIYPNGSADVNHFHAAGGMAYLIRELLDAGLLHGDIDTVAGPGLRRYTQEPFLEGDTLVWRDGQITSLDDKILRPVSEPFNSEGGIRLLTGNLGRSIIKISAVQPEHHVIEAPAVVFDSQYALEAAFHDKKLEKDFIAVIRFQGPMANGMPELHRLTPILTAIQNQGHKVALITDGRMSGASGKVPAAIHMTPEALRDGPIGKIRDGDIICLDAERGTLDVKVDDSEFAQRSTDAVDLSGNNWGMGRELFGHMRRHCTTAEEGASSLFDGWDETDVRSRAAQMAG